ncbi:hypothetical protein SAMN05444004_113108 [Jannaschia faecimaris]|uniref:Uncharacterized protein n=1 Tax=Jannaschia faecimaris TaxID=1244108 RepID=A0A1H3STS2_9RHOB|nr:hypothetical protein [Jannaschia faecimaris]SDZ41344.1 hypothetical protein SAMN05444004_113108 [Jannaschia faecimaris]
MKKQITPREYSEQGGIRCPTICIRSGKPNAAAVGFFSSILRETLNGQAAILPVGDDIRHWHASPHAAVGFIEHAATLDGATLDNRRNLTMPGVSATVGEQIEALRRVAGDAAVALIRHEPDPMIHRIVSGWAQGFDTSRAR